MTALVGWVLFGSLVVVGVKWMLDQEEQNQDDYDKEDDD
jgi:hypothetical protein